MNHLDLRVRTYKDCESNAPTREQLKKDVEDWKKNGHTVEMCESNKPAGWQGYTGGMCEY